MTQQSDRQRERERNKKFLAKEQWDEKYLIKSVNE
jgi:hypothetical protein